MKRPEPNTMPSDHSSDFKPISDAEIELLEGRFSALEDSLASLYGALPFGMHTLDPNQLFSKINRFEQETLGYEYSELLGKKKMTDLLSPESHAPYAAFLENPSLYQYPSGVSLRLISKHGVVLAFRLSQVGGVTDNSGSRSYVLYSETSMGLIDDRLRIAAIAFESHQGAIVTDINKRILRVNSAFTAISGYSEEEVVGKTPNILNSGKHSEEFYKEMWRTINATGKWQGTISNKRKNGESYTQFLTITEVRDKEGRLINYVGSMADISQELASQETIARLAYYDALTLLPNRRLLINRLEQALVTISRHKSKGAVLFIDLDNFKVINDTKGHGHGDLLLKTVAERLLACVRSGDTVARMGGDEYIVLLDNLGEDSARAAKNADAVCTKIHRALLTPIDIEGLDYSVTASIGVAMIEDAGFSVDELLKQADIAMYQAKTDGRNAQRFFDEKMQVAIMGRTLLEADLRSALKGNELELFFQLQVCEAGGAIGAEALIRWNHPKRGLLNPGEFIPMAEESGLICELGRWVLKAACMQLQQWADDPVFKQLQVSINISAREFREAKFVQQVANSLKNFAVPFGALKFELTEGMLVANIDEAVKSMEALVALGVLIEIDDFGTGFSSLKYIHKFPISRMKIDQSFVNKLTDKKSTIVIIRAIIAMANALGIEVIAEGVENAAQLELLKSEGCRQFQGYFIAKPMPVAAFEQFMRNRPA